MENSSSRNLKAGFGLLVFSISLATFMSGLDGTIVNIAIPTISESFNLSSSTVSWVATAYLVVMAGCVLIFGKVSDIIGFRKVFLLGFMIFTAGSFTCGFLPDLLNSFPSLVASRIFQAIGGAMITAIAPAMITEYIPQVQKGKAMGIVMTMAALGTALGPTIGGVVTQYLSWNWIFFINVPVGIVALILGAKVIPRDVQRCCLAGFDRLGAALIFIGLAALLFVLSEGFSFGWTSPVILCLAALAVVTLSWFTVHELRLSDPLLDIRLFRNRNFLCTNLVLILVYFSFSGINYLIPFYLEYVRGFGSSDSGLILSALSFAMMGAGILAGLLFNRVGPRFLCIGAGIILTLGYFLLVFLHSDTPIGYLILSLIFIGLGLGLVITPASNMVMNSVPRAKGGMVSSLTGLERFAPLTLGIAVFNMVFIHGIIVVAAEQGVTKMAPVAIRQQILVAGFDLAFFLSLALGVVILILALIARQEIHPDYQGSETSEPVIL